MNIILLPRQDGRARHFNLAHPFTLGIVALLMLGILGAGFAIGLRLGERSTRLAASGTAAAWAATLAAQQREIADTKERLQERVDALALRIGQVNADMIRLNALGKRLTQMADINSREFNFDAPAGVGGPENDVGVAAQIPDLTQMIDELEKRAELRNAQLTALENVIITRKLNEEIRPEGRPVRQGFISSYFGERQDPFTGHEAIHKGVDFAGDLGSRVSAVASGVVTWAGERSGYGQLIEINHGNGLVTRYGHNARTLVGVGQIVTRGQPIALMGSTGRSTGPHVHFEVLRNGRQIDPLSFVGR
jgi:murein DD-endopeptidase MepM/ murein hydrolase activator NlpD